MLKIVFKKDDFTQALEYCITSIEKKNTMPILSHIILEFKGTDSKFISTNLDTSVIVRSVAENSDGEGLIALPAKYIYDICKVTVGELIELEYDQEHMLLNITAEKSKYTIPCADPTTFPAVTEEEGDGKDVQINKLITFFKKLSFSMTETNINKAYSGVLINRVEENGNKKIEMVTTDIHRISVLSLKNFSMDIEGLDNGIVISGRNFSEIGKVFGGEETVKMWVNDGKIIIKSPSVTFISRLIKNEFPNYKSVIGTIDQIEQKEYALISRKELIGAVKRVIALNTEEKIWATKFEFRGNVLTMNAHSEFGGNSSDEILIEKGFEKDNNIGINSKYLIDVLSVLDSERVNIIVEEGLRPLTIKEENDDIYYIHMVMPLRM